MTYYCDKARHLVCVPYSVENLHKMAEDLGIGEHWFHKSKKCRKGGCVYLYHYDIPLKRIEEITEKCTVVSSKDIVRIIKGEFEY